MSPSIRATRAAGWPRRLTPELLDALPASDPGAVRSRGDLRRINRITGARSLLLRALAGAAPAPTHVVELGSGDGTLALRIAQARARRWPGVRLTLLDREPCVAPETVAAIRGLGWSVEVLAADVRDWLGSTHDPADIMFANLFVHHFEGAALAHLVTGLARRCAVFVCCEPRRSLVALAGSHLLGLIGCNAVTRHDAVVSVEAGFRDRELSAAWLAAQPQGWELHEASAGAFSHLFVARRAP